MSVIRTEIFICSTVYASLRINWLERISCDVIGCIFKAFFVSTMSLSSPLALLFALSIRIYDENARRPREITVAPSPLLTNAQKRPDLVTLAKRGLARLPARLFSASSISLWVMTQIWARQRMESLPWQNAETRRTGTSFLLVSGVSKLSFFTLRIK